MSPGTVQCPLAENSPGLRAPAPPQPDIGWKAHRGPIAFPGSGYPSVQRSSATYAEPPKLSSYLFVYTSTQLRAARGSRTIGDKGVAQGVFGIALEPPDAHAAQAEFLRDVRELLGWRPPIPLRRTMTVRSG